MLKKLLKYDLKDIINKFLIVFYILALIFSILTRIFMNINDSIMFYIIGKICSGTQIAFICNILINNIMRLLGRFKGTIYGDESYLTHTLPVTKNNIYLSKILASIISLVLSFIVIIISLFIAYYSKENLDYLKNFLSQLSNMYNIGIISLLLVSFLVIFLEFINILQIGFTGLIIGHKKNNYKILYSVIYGFVSYFVLQGFVFLILVISAIFNKDIMNLFTSNSINNLSILKTILLLSIISYTISFVINYFINLKLFTKGVNVE